MPAGDYVRVSVEDHGPGIGKNLLPKIFDPYFSTKPMGDQKGMGLGLTICHSVVQKHGGMITVNSKEGVMTTFAIYLPAAGNLSEKKKVSARSGIPQPAGTNFSIILSAASPSAGSPTRRLDEKS